MLRCQIIIEASEKAGIVLRSGDIFYHETVSVRGMDRDAFIAGVIAARKKKSNLISERAIKLRFSDFPLQRRPHTRECVTRFQCGILQQECEIAMIITARTLSGYHLDASSSGPSKLGRVGTL